MMISDNSSVQSDLTDEEHYTSDGIKHILSQKNAKESCRHLKSSGTTSKVSNEDHRTLYPKILEQGFNSSDPVLMREIFEMLLHPDCSVDSARLQTDTGKEELESSAGNKENVIEYFLGYLVAIPDIVFLVHDWQIFSRPNKQSCLVIKFSLSGTKIYDIRTNCCEEEGETDTSSTDESTSPTNGKVIKNKRGSVLFREMSRASKYDTRKRRRVSTVGQFIESNRVTGEYTIPSLSSCPTSDDSSCDSDALLSEMRQCPHVQLLPEATKVNIVGIMRFTMNEEGKITRILCTHIHDA